MSTIVSENILQYVLKFSWTPPDNELRKHQSTIGKLNTAWSDWTLNVYFKKNKIFGIGHCGNQPSKSQILKPCTRNKHKGIVIQYCCWIITSLGFDPKQVWLQHVKMVIISFPNGLKLVSDDKRLSIKLSPQSCITVGKVIAYCPKLHCDKKD